MVFPFSIALAFEPGMYKTLLRGWLLATKGAAVWEKQRERESPFLYIQYIANEEILRNTMSDRQHEVIIW